MPTYRRQTLANGGTAPAPVIEPLTGLMPMRRDPALQAIRGQDKVASLGRRIILSYGLCGSHEWRMPNASNPYAASRVYPDRTTWYVVARGRCELTPGCALRVRASVLPSGCTQRAATAGEIAAGSPAFRSDGNYGRLRVTVTWTDRSAATEQTVYTIALPASAQETGSEGTDAGALFRDLRPIGAYILRPPDVIADLSEARRFSRYGTIDVLVEHQGSPRVVDLTVSETPDIFVVEDADPGTYRTQHAYASTPDAAVPPPPFPRERNSATDPRGGSLQILGTARAQRDCLGPLLFQAHAYGETGATATATVVPWTTSNDGTTYESILDSALTAYTATEPGWSVSCGGYARTWKDAGYYVLRDRIAVIPVLIRVYGRTITAGTGTVRVMTAAHSYVDVPIAIAGSNAWSRAYGWLEVGITPEQQKTAQVFFNHAGASGSLSIEAVEVYYSGTPAVV